MKKTFLLAALAAFTFFGTSVSNAQDVQVPISSESKLIEYAETVPMAGLKKDELYKRGLAWFNKYYKNPASVIKKQSPETGEIEGIYIIKTYNTDKEGKKIGASDIGYTVSLLFKDDKYRYVVTKFNKKGASYTPIESWADKNSKGYQAAYADYLKQIDTEVKALVADIKKGMNDSGVKAKSDW